MENIFIIANLILLIIVIAPLLFGKNIIYFLSKKKLPIGILESSSFEKIGNQISYLWAVIFFISIFIDLTFAISFQIIIGVPFSIIIPKYILQKEKIRFKSLKDAFESMPFGLNREIAKNVDVLIKFTLSGVEKQISFLEIKNQKAIFSEKSKKQPTLEIISDSQLWLNIINGNIDGSNAFIDKKYEMIGDASIMLIFDKLFDTSAKIEKIQDRKQDYRYWESPKKIQNIVVFDGGIRSKKFSKTSLIVDKFLEGAKSAGANIEEFRLSKLNIKSCDGCYMCWTKTAGECVHKDSMTELREKYRKADLIIFASPLYTFNVTGVMKTFMDRLLPLMKPYMLIKENGKISHPDRFPEFGEQGFLVFSSSGFPDIDGNFDGLKGMYRAFSSHNENLNLMGEFFLTASEILAQPVYKKRRDLIEEACFEAGIQIVNDGKVDYKFMATLSNPTISSKVFQNQANHFWKNLDGKESYLKNIPKL